MIKLNRQATAILTFFALILLNSPACYAADPITFGTKLSIWQDVKSNVFDRSSKSLQDEDLFRFKLSLRGRWNYNKNLAAYIKLGSESTYTIDSYNPDKHDFQWDELIIENLYIDAKNIFQFPVDLRIGRQELLYGDGLLVADGTSSDRERTSYFNAVKSTLRFSKNNNVDLVYINDPKTDEFLPSLRSGANTSSSYLHHKRILTTSDEQGVIVYSRYRFENGLSLEPYYIYKREGSIAGGRTASKPALAVHTFGTRSVYDNDMWKLSGEFAGQTGEYGDGKGRTGYGANVYVSRLLKDTMWQPEFELGYTYLSGDDAKTGTNEGWDPLFSRWNSWSKFYSSSFTTETGINSYWTNLQMYRATTRLDFVPGTNLSISYNYLRANETTNITGSAASYLSNSGKERGHLAQARLNFKLTKNVDGYLAYEYFFPGDFYRLRSSQSILTWKLNFKLDSEALKTNGDQDIN